MMTQNDIIINKLYSGRLRRFHYAIAMLTLFPFYAFIRSFVPSDFHSTLFMILNIIISSLDVRRLHDIGITGYFVWGMFLLYYLINSIQNPFGLILLGVFIEIYLLVKSGEKFTNKYGPVVDKKKKLINALLSKQEEEKEEKK